MARNRLPRRTLLSFLALVALTITLRGPAAGAGGQAESQPVTRVGLTPQTLQSLIDLHAGEGPGGIVAYARVDGQEPVLAASGLADRDRGTAMRVEDRFRAYSITKAFTATVVLQLVDEGRLDLDQRVTQWLEDPAVARLPYVEQITVRQLLNHSSGLYDYLDDDSPFLNDAFFGPDADPARVWTPQELLAYGDGARHAAYFAPGEGVRYSNTGYIVLGLIVEQVTGETLEAEMARRIFGPLGLHDTTLDDRYAQQAADGYVPGYLPGPNGDVISLAGSNASWAWAAGGVISNARDLARFGQALFTGELLRQESALRMFTFPDGDEGGAVFGFGVFRADTVFGRLFGAEGGSGGYAALLVRVPEAHLTAVVLQNWWPNHDESKAVVAGVVALAEGPHR